MEKRLIEERWSKALRPNYSKCDTNEINIKREPLNHYGTKLFSFLYPILIFFQSQSSNESRSQNLSGLNIPIEKENHGTKGLNKVQPLNGVRLGVNVTKIMS